MTASINYVWSMCSGSRIICVPEQSLNRKGHPRPSGELRAVETEDLEKSRDSWIYESQRTDQTSGNKTVGRRGKSGIAPTLAGRADGISPCAAGVGKTKP